MKYLFFIACLFFACSASGQQQSGGKDTIVDNVPVFTYVDEMPQPPYDLGRYFKDNLNYPAQARAKGIQGRVTVKFIITKWGTVEHASIVKGIGAGCDEEALRLVNNKFLTWKPAKKDGKEVSVFYVQPIEFKL